MILKEFALLPSNSFKYFYTNTFEFYCEILPNNIFSHDRDLKCFLVDRIEPGSHTFYNMHLLLAFIVQCVQILHCAACFCSWHFMVQCSLCVVYNPCFPLQKEQGFTWLYWYVYMNFELRYTSHTTIFNVHCQIMYVVWYMP